MSVIESKECSQEKIQQVLKNLEKSSHDQKPKPKQSNAKISKKSAKKSVVDHDTVYEPPTHPQKRKLSSPPHPQIPTKKAKLENVNAKDSQNRIELAKSLLSGDETAITVLDILSSVVTFANDPDKILKFCNSKTWELMNSECETPEEHEQHEIAHQLQEQFPEQSNEEIQQLAVKLYKKKHQ